MYMYVAVIMIWVWLAFAFILRVGVVLFSCVCLSVNHLLFNSMFLSLQLVKINVYTFCSVSLCQVNHIS